MSKRIKCFIVSLAVLLGALTPQTVFAAQGVRVFFDGGEVVYDVPPQVIGGRTMVPLSQTIQAITGSPAGWDSNTKTVTFSANGHTNVHNIGQTIVYVDGAPVQFDTPSLIIDSRTLVPVRMIAETSGCKVDWDGNKKYVIITSPAAVTPAVAPEASAAQRPVIESVSAGKTKITKGEAVTLTVKTNTAASYVWVECDDADKYAEVTSAASGGTKTWTVSCTPTGSQSLHIYANTARSLIDSAMEIQYIEVSQSNVPSIISLTASKTSAVSGEAVTFTVRTSGNVQYVWAEYDGEYKDASFQSTYANGEKSWGVSIVPSKTQRVRVYANTSSRAATGADSRAQDIIVSAAASPEILSVNSGQSGASYTFTVKTNSAVRYVWLNADNSKVYANNQSASGDTKTWTATISPSAAQRVYIYANTSDSQSGAVYETQQVSVASKPKIVSYETPDGAWIMPGDIFTVNVTTSGSVNSVWVEGLGGDDWQGYLTNSGNSGNQEWQVNCSPSGSGRIKLYIYASSGDSSSSVATEIIYVTIGN